MGSKPSSSSSTSSTTAPPSWLLGDYQGAIGSAQSAASTPYTPYSGQLVAPVNSQQTSGINAINSAAGVQNGYNTSATGLLNSGSGTINPGTVGASQISQYESPYQSQVINSTEAELNNQDAQQSAQLTGAAIGSGAFGGNRAGVAQASLAGQQDLANNSTIASLNNQNYQQALSEANTQQQTGLQAQEQTAANQLNAGSAYGTLGNTAQTEALNEANAQTNAGTLQQQTSQAGDTANYNQYLQAQSYPFQTDEYLSSILGSLGSLSGGTTTGSSQQNTSSLGTILGGAIGLGSLLARGGRVPHMASGGGLGGPVSLDMPYSDQQQGLGAGSIVPTTNLASGHTMPSGQTGSGASSTQSPMQTAQGISQMSSAIGGLGQNLGSLGSSASFAANPDATLAGLGGGDASIGALALPFKRGGTVRPRYDDGGGISLGDLMFDPTAMNDGATTLPNATQAATAVPIPTSTGTPAAIPVSAASTGLGSGTSNYDGALPRGIRNNNPGNLVDNEWTQGLPGYTGSDGRFATFATPADGSAALDHNLQSYGSQGVTTPLQIASRWAPSGDGGNDPTSYAAVIAKQAGVGINDPINMSDPTTRAAVASGITRVENGAGYGGASPASGVMSYDDQGTGGSSSSGGLGAIQAMLSGGQSGVSGGTGVPASSVMSGLNTAAGGMPNESKGLLGVDMPDNVRMGLLAAGLGMMGGTSSNPWINIGQGGLQGIQAMESGAHNQAQIALERAQTQGAVSDNQLKMMRVKAMFDGLNQMDNDQKANAKTIQQAPTPSQSASPSQSETIPGSVASPAPNTAIPSTPVGSAPATSQRQIDPAYNPIALTQRADQYAKLAFADPSYASVANTLRQQAQAYESGTAMVHYVNPDGSDGGWDYMPGNTQAKANVAGATAGAEASAKANYDLVQVQPQPGGPTVFMPKTQALAQAANNPNQTTVGVGAGSPPGSKMDAVAQANPVVAQQPGWIADRQKAMAADDETMGDQFATRQLSKQRLQALQSVMQTYQPGAFAEEKADLVAGLRSAGFSVPDSATANPAAFQEFIKNATANVFNDVKSMGGRVLVSEIQGLTKANANPELQPAAAAAIIGQGLGVINYEDQHYQDYMNWRNDPKNANAYQTSPFEIPWMKSHPVSQYVDQATKGIAYQGQTIPAAAQRSVGQTYLTPKGPAVWKGTGWALANQ